MGGKNVVEKSSDHEMDIDEFSVGSSYTQSVKRTTIKSQRGVHSSGSGVGLTRFGGASRKQSMHSARSAVSSKYTGVAKDKRRIPKAEVAPPTIAPQLDPTKTIVN